MRNKLFIAFTIIILFIGGCQINEKEVKAEQSVQETMDSTIGVSDDLVYREYSLGEKFYPCEIVISKETLLSSIREPKTLIVYFNDEIRETIDYHDTDIQISLVNEGIYCFMVVNKNNETVDITSQVQGTSYVGSRTEYIG